MKGPGLRLDLDVRRVWECPACSRRERFDGDVVSATCRCREGGVAMKLIEPRRQVRTFEIPAPASMESASPAPAAAETNASPLDTSEDQVAPASS